jgi:glutaminase A-like protein/uncharacterized protein DUF5127/uncharacterized protein DUF4964
VFRRMHFTLLAWLLICSSSLGAANALRPPAVPLVTCDPYFSIWSPSDRLTDSDTTHWSGVRQALTSLARIDGHSYRLMGTHPPNVPALPQISLDVTPTQTIYGFEGSGLHVTLTFTTPLLPRNLEIFSRPVTYLTWSLRSVDGKEHTATIYYDNTAEPVVNTVDQPVVWSHEQSGNLAVMRMGTQLQPVLAKSGDNLRIDWGYLYVATAHRSDTQEVIADRDAAQQEFALTGSLPAHDDPRMPRPAADHMPVMAVAFRFTGIGPNPAERHVILAYDDLYSVELLHHRLRPYWRRNGDEAPDLLYKAEADYPSLVAECRSFDRELEDDLTRLGGPGYASLGAMTYREALSANKLAADADGKPLFFPKENFSDGSISTPDVIYPESPILLVFNPGLLRASLVPVFQYVTSGRWRFRFAPAQLGTYPLANGQTYGGGETSEENQQPVEETANMLIMTAALAQMGQATDLTVRYWPVLAGWAQYLREKGLDPDKQLCTDDFAGPMAHNANLSLKAIEGLGAYSLLCKVKGDHESFAVYRHAASEYASEWIKKAQDGDHFRLAFDQPGTWSQKYNLVWDKLLGLALFPDDVARAEVGYYKQKLSTFGFDLDTRHSYTKLDWEVWSASLAESRADFETLMKPVYEYVNRTPSRVPLSDWYGSTDGKHVVYHNRHGEELSFRARPVVGGVFMRLLMDTPTWKKWSSKASGAQ